MEQNRELRNKPMHLWSTPLEEGMPPTPVFLPGGSNVQKSLVCCKFITAKTRKYHTCPWIFYKQPIQIWMIESQSNWVGIGLCAQLLSSVQLSATPWSGSSVNGIFQARILEWLAISFSRGSSQLRDWKKLSLVPPPLADRFSTTVLSGKPKLK